MASDSGLGQREPPVGRNEFLLGGQACLDAHRGEVLDVEHDGRQHQVARARSARAASARSRGDRGEDQEERDPFFIARPPPRASARARSRARRGSFSSSRRTSSPQVFGPVGQPHHLRGPVDRRGGDLGVASPGGRGVEELPGGLAGNLPFRYQYSAATASARDAGSGSFSAATCSASL